MLVWVGVSALLAGLVEAQCPVGVGIRTSSCGAARSSCNSGCRVASPCGVVRPSGCNVVPRCPAATTCTRTATTAACCPTAAAATSNNWNLNTYSQGNAYPNYNTNNQANYGNTYPSYPTNTNNNYGSSSSSNAGYYNNNNNNLGNAYPNQYPTATGGAYPQPAPLINGYVRPQTPQTYGSNQYGQGQYGTSSNTFATGFGSQSSGPMITINGQPMQPGQTFNLGSGPSPLSQTQNFGSPYPNNQYTNNNQYGQPLNSAYFPGKSLSSSAASSARAADPNLQATNRTGSEKVPLGYSFDYSGVPIQAYYDEIRKQAAMHPVLMYSATTCSYCKKAKAQLRSMGIQFAYFDWDAHRGDKGPEMFNALSQLYGNGQLKTVPQILVCGQLIGGYDALMTRVNAGTLRSTLASCPPRAVEKKPVE